MAAERRASEYLLEDLKTLTSMWKIILERILRKWDGNTYRAGRAVVNADLMNISVRWIVGGFLVCLLKQDSGIWS